MKRILALLFVLGAPAALAQTTPLDGDWTGKSDGGSCNAPLDFALSIEAGIVDGTASDPSVKGPVPNLKKSAPPQPMPGLWQVYGAARSTNFSLRAVASVKGTDHRETRFLVTVQGTTLVLIENGGCSRKASLTRTKG